jgi:hypothetical protein
VAFKSSAPPAAQQTLVSSFEALAQQCLHPKTGKPYITSLKCGRQNSPEGMTKGLELIFVLEFEVSHPLSSSLILSRSSSPQFSPPYRSILRAKVQRTKADRQNLEDRDYYLDHDPAHVDFKVSPLERSHALHGDPCPKTDDRTVFRTNSRLSMSLSWTLKLGNGESRMFR